MLAALQSQYGEVPVYRGLAGPTAALLVLVNAETGTWTLIHVTPGMVACGIASGESWEAIEVKPAGREG